MIKKTMLLAAGGVLVLGLLFGRNLMPYAGTAIDKAQSWADSQVDTSYKIDTARRQLELVRENVKPMVYEMAKQKVEINRLAKQIENQDESLAKSHLRIMRLRDHLESGDTAYVSSHGNRFNNDRVRSDLANRFRRYKNGEEQLNTLRTTLELRQVGLDAAEKNLEETLAQQRTLSVEIENLEAQMKMLDVARTASEYSRIDDSALARANEMIEEIRSRLETDSMMLNMAPALMGEIPMDEASEEDNVDIIDAVDRYFGTTEDTVVTN